jgi:Ran GTPase-activating protein (RanGAP) involved in mRNA processing and transport
MSDNEDDVDSYVQGLDDTTYYSGSGSDEDDFGYDDNESGDGSSDDDYDEEVYYSTPASSVPRLCAQLRANDPSVLPEGPNEVFQPHVPESCRLEIAEALLQNTIVRRIALDLQHYSELSADAMAKYLAQSKRLLYVELSSIYSIYSFESTTDQQLLSSFIEAVGKSNSIKELNLSCPDLGPTGKSFENLLTRTKSLRHLRVDLSLGRQGPLEDAVTAAIASGCSKNTTLREIHLVNLQETSLTPVLTALQMHPLLEKLHVVGYASLAGMDALLRGNNSQIKELIIGQFNGSLGAQIVSIDLDGFTGEQIVGFESFMQEMERNTTIRKMAITGVHLRRDNIQQLTAMLRRNTVLQDLDLSGDALGSAGLAKIASVLYRNTSIQGLDVSDNGLDDLAAANALRELLHRNEAITRLNMCRNYFGWNVAVVRGIANCFRASTTLQELNLSYSSLGDQGLTILAEGLGQQNRGLVALNLSVNQITCSGLRALMDNATAALSTVTHLNLDNNLILDEGASFLAETLGMQMLSSLKSLQLGHCGISDDGLVPLLSALEENETLETVNLAHNAFSLQGYLVLASSLPNIKGLRQINFSLPTTDPSVMPALLEGFRKNSSLHDVNIPGGEHGTYWSQELSFFLYRNKFGRLLQDSDTDDRESLGLWSRALGSVATRPDVLFHVLTPKAGLIGATPG